MRILKVEGTNRIIIQVNETELDTIVNNYLDQQYCIGYEEGYNANMDHDDRTEE